MKAQIHLEINEQLLLNAQRVAAENNITLSELVEQFFSTLLRPEQRGDLLAYVDQLEPSLIDADTNLKTEFYKQKRHSRN